MNWREKEERVRSTSERSGAARIEITNHGPYRVTGDVVIFDAEGTLLRRTGTWCLCRCGGSRNKPFCDVTHGLKGFDGTETADHGAIADRRDSYPADGVTVFDDRSRCAHFGQCTNRLPAVFRATAEPFVDPHNAAPDSIADVVAGCPSARWPTPAAATATRWRLPPSRRSRRSSRGPTGCAGRFRSSVPMAARTRLGPGRRCVGVGSRATSRSVTAPTGTPGSATRSRGVEIVDYDEPWLRTVDGVADVAFALSAWFVDPGGNTIGLLQIKDQTLD
jgi:CDGSH-type Zn-finger protein